MANCKDCIHEKVCKYADEKVSLGTTVKETVHECIDYKSTADVVEVKHGEWIYGENETAHCSECDNEVPEHSVTRYCDYCGANMDEED